MSAKLPTQRQRLTLDRPDLSAREADKLIAPHADSWPWSTSLIRVQSAGAVAPNGRLSVGVGAWYFSYWCSAREVGIIYGLFYNGNLSYQYPISRNGAPLPTEIENSWIDSIDIATRVAAEPPPTDGKDIHLSHLALHGSAQRQCWEAWRTDYSAENRIMRKQTLLLDAESGAILFDAFEVSENGVCIHSTQHVRGPR